MDSLTGTVIFWLGLAYCLGWLSAILFTFGAVFVVFDFLFDSGARKAKTIGLVLIALGLAAGAGVAILFFAFIRWGTTPHSVSAIKSQGDHAAQIRRRVGVPQYSAPIKATLAALGAARP